MATITQDSAPGDLTQSFGLHEIRRACGAQTYMWPKHQYALQNKKELTDVPGRLYGPEIPAVGKLKKEDHKFKASLDNLLII